jgi:hypothetical protein
MDYVNEVDRNAALRATHEINPKSSMKNFGLSKDERDAVLSGSERRLAEAAGLDQDCGAKLQSTHIPQGYYSEN